MSREDKIKKIGERRLRDTYLGRYIQGEASTGLRRLTPSERKKAAPEFSELDGYTYDFSPYTITKIEKELYQRVLHQDNIIREITFEESICSQCYIAVGAVTRSTTFSYHGGFSALLAPAAAGNAEVIIHYPIPESKRIGIECFFALAGTGSANITLIQFTNNMQSARTPKVTLWTVRYTVATDIWDMIGGVNLNPLLAPRQNNTIAYWLRFKALYDLNTDTIDYLHIGATDMRPVPIAGIPAATGLNYDYGEFGIQTSAVGGTGALHIDDITITDEGDSI